MSEAAPLGRDFRALGAATAVSNLGDGVTLAAAPLLAASLTRSPNLVAGLSFVTTLPWLLFSLVAGAATDRYDRRRLMVTVAWLRAGLLGLVALGVAFDSIQLWTLYLAMFASSTGEVVNDCVTPAFLAKLVDEDRLHEANGRLEVAVIVPNLLAGPPLGGLLFAVAAASAFALDAASFALTAALLLAIRPRPHPVTPAPADAGADADGSGGRSLRAEIVEGVRFVRRSRLLTVLLATLAAFNFLVAARMATFVLLAQDRLGLDGFGVGLVMGAMAVGGIVAGLTGERVARRVGDGSAVLLALLAEALAAAVVPFTRSPWVVAATLAIGGYAGVTWNVVTTTLRQRVIPDELMGRAFSVYRMFGMGALALGAIAGGLLADGFGLTSPYVLTAAAGVAGIALLRRPLSNRAIASALAAGEVTAPPRDARGTP